MTNKIDIQKRLHHRHPYLLIDEVVEHSDKHLHARKLSTQNDFFQAGHFPGAPVVPGAMMQEMTTQAAGLLIAEYYSPVADYDSEKTKGFALGVLRAIHQAKYKKFVRSQDELNIKVELIEKIESSFYFKAHIEVAGIKVMSNEFTLVNISEEKLIGD
jgi:3-hydroxyacyl-[acyl-carrier-protein] dehydratase